MKLEKTYPCHLNEGEVYLIASFDSFKKISLYVRNDKGRFFKVLIFYFHPIMMLEPENA